MQGFIKELRRRNVFRVAVAYVVVAWLLAQVAELALDSFEAPAWVIKAILLLLALGFPLAVFFAWAFELTPEGIRKEKDVERSRSITAQTGRRLDRMIIGFLAVAVAFLLVDKFVLQDPPAATVTVSEPVAVVEEAADADSIAVLPFVDMSPNRDQDYFTDGLTENLLHALAQIRELKVAGRTSSFAFKGQNLDLRSIGEQLGVRNILEGSVQKAGNRVRITAQLVNAGDGFHLWSESFDRDLDDIFLVQDEITAAVVSALRENILGEDEISASYAGDYRAYNAYLLGQSLANLATYESWEKAAEQYRLALEIDPGMALAWAGLSEVISEQTGYGSGDQGFKSSFDEGYEQARHAANRAIELDPNLPEGYLALAEVHRAYDWDWDAVESALRRALDLRPGDPDIRARLAELMAIRGEFDEALRQSNQALALDPLNRDVQRWRLWVLVALGRLDEALAGAQQVYEAEPERGAMGVLLSMVHMDRGEYQQALEAARRETFPFLRLTMETIALDALGDRAAADAKLRLLIEEFGDDVSYQVAAIYAMRGDLDRAFEALERGFAIRDPGLTYIQVHTSLDAVRDDPRYEALLEKMGLR